MRLEDLKIPILNGLTFGVTFTNIEMALKILLLLLSILYTWIKIYDFFKKKEKWQKTLVLMNLTVNAGVKCPMMFTQI